MPRQRKRSISPLEERSHRRTSQRQNKNNCRLCHRNHPLRKCIKFKRLNVSEKLKVVKRYRYCENCLAHSHQVNRCRNTDRCRQCGSRHHSLLHRHERLRTPRPASSSSSLNSRTITLLPTVIAKVELDSKWYNVRGLLNPCSEVSCIAEFLVERYKLKEEKVEFDRWCQIKIRPRFDDALILSLRVKIVNDLPSKQPKELIDERVAELYANLHLADPNFYKPMEINIILGADIYPRLIKSGIQPQTIGSPMAQDTVLGWILVGKFGV
ncbi:uncharacterized protein ACRADG_004330 [Cochliomyia hominivorax]